jgi:hypothetical protein
MANVLTLLKRNLAGVLVAVIGLTGGAAALAQAQTDDAPPSAPPAQADRPLEHRGGRMGPMGRAVHGDLIVRNQDGGYVPVTFDRGALESVGSDQLTIARPDGVKVTVKLDGETRYRGVASKDELRTGEGALVVSEDGVATMVGQRPDGAPELGPGRRERQGPAANEAT